MVSLHDVHPTTAASSRHLLQLIEQRGIRASLLVVCGPRSGQRLPDDPALVAWLRAAVERGHEVAVHGWNHTAEPGHCSRRALANRVIASGRAEFAALAEDAARGRLERCLDVMDGVGLRPVGFTPPGWLASSETLDALFRLGFAYSTNHLSVIDLWLDRTFRIPAVCQRPRSSLSAIDGSLVRRIAVRRLTHGEDLRLALHPSHADDERLLETTRCLLDVAACGRTLTYAELVDAATRPIGIQ